jgi:erythromycin esterase-like protein
MPDTIIHSTDSAVATLRDAIHPLRGERSDFDPLFERIGDAGLVLIGEASHGTHEFYRIRAEITKRLITEHGFGAVAVEADWPDAYRVNRYVRGLDGDSDASEALPGFVRFPQWMWRNADVLDFVGWLRAHNDGQAESARAGFYGLDLYSLHASIAAVLQYLDTADPAASRRARERYACFDRFEGDPQSYGYAASLGLAPSCEADVVAQLVDLRRTAASLPRSDHQVIPDDLFYAAQNALVVANAERYYRAMFGGRALSWNLRDGHMADTLDALVTHLSGGPGRAKVVVWAHNSHLGDARTTEQGRSGELNLGQLVRERHGEDSVAVGFSTYGGTVTAASDWDEPAERMIVRPALPHSYELLFHQVGVPNFLVVTREPGAAAVLTPLRLQRAIGVIYRPGTERQSHYYHAQLARQFDAMLHYDVTRAVEPLDRSAPWSMADVPESYPTAL